MRGLGAVLYPLLNAFALTVALIERFMALYKESRLRGSRAILCV